jgi:hypothetical protein
MSATANEKTISLLKDALFAHGGPYSLADASSKSGLSLTETQAALNYLVAEYRGNLAATSEGELLYSFPTGFQKPWEQKERLEKLWAGFKKGLIGTLKFITRAWISIVMVGYVVIFALILIALSFSKNSDRDDSPSFSSSLMLHALMRMVIDSLFWTFHPFSPFSVHYNDYDDYAPRQKKAPFYERVNRFFFGPEEKVMDQSEKARMVLQEIRARQGRIGLIDVMRISGMSKSEADPFMAKLLLDHEGDVKVSEEGAIYYEFASMRKTALRENISPLPSIWQSRDYLSPFTGNSAGSNLLIAGLNAFNLLMSSVAISQSWTIEKFRYILTFAKSGLPPELLPPPPEGTALILGWIPFVFSLVLFAIPVLRAINRPNKKREVDRKNGRRGLLRIILNKFALGGVKEDVLKDAWAKMAEAPVNEKDFKREIIDLDGEAEISESADLVFRFKSLESELKALERARKEASAKESSVGDVIFSSAK